MSSASDPHAGEEEVLDSLPPDSVSLAEAFVSYTQSAQETILARLRTLASRVATRRTPQQPKPAVAPARLDSFDGLPTADVDRRISCRSHSEAVLTAAVGDVKAILDTGASRCVMGSKLVGPFLSQLGDQKQHVRVAKSSVRFRFGNNQTLTSERRLLVPLRVAKGPEMWIGIEVVPGATPLLMSKRALKMLGGIIDTTTDTCQLSRLHMHIPPFRSTLGQLAYT